MFMVEARGIMQLFLSDATAYLERFLLYNKIIRL